MPRVVQIELECRRKLPAASRLSSAAVKPARESRRATPSPELSWRLVKADGRPARIVAFEEAVVGFFLDSASRLGVPKSVAAIHGICFASPMPLCFSDIQERLDISAGSISHGLRVLNEIGALKMVRTNLSRREFFTPEVELGKLVKYFLDRRLKGQLDSFRGRLQAMGDRVPNGDAESVKFLRARLKVLRTWHDQTQTLLPVVRRFFNLA